MRVTGVLLDDGEQLSADAVSTLARRTMLELIHLRQVPPKVARDVRRIRVRGIHAKVHMVVKEPLFPHARVRLGESPNALERPTTTRATRRAAVAPLDIRQVGNVVSIWAYGATHELRGGWNDDARDALGRAVRARLEEATGDLSSRVEATEVLTPADLEAQYGLEGGHVLHGEMGLDQLWIMRPTPRMSHGDSGIEGLVLGSDGTHPGVPLSLVSGCLAAERLLEA